MKRTLLCLVIVLACTIIKGQQVKKVRKVVPLLAQQSSYLNGGFRASLGGKSRVIFEISLPANTVEWYYVFTTTKTEKESKSMNLIPQLTRFFDPSGMSAILASAIVTPTGSNSCDVFLMSRPNAEAFINKADLNGGRYSHILSAARENFRNGEVQIKDVKSGVYYLGFRNPSTSDGIGIIVEAAAIVEEYEIDNSVWVSETKEKLYQQFYLEFVKKGFEEVRAKELASCIVIKTTEGMSPAEFENMPNFQKENYLNKSQEECTKKVKKVITPEQEKAIIYGNLGWKAFEAGNIEKCIEFSKKALAMDNSLGWVKANIGLCFLIKEEEETATAFYIEALADIKKNNPSDTKFYLKSTIDDINNAVTKYSNLKSVEFIKDLFEMELKSY